MKHIAPSELVPVVTPKMDPLLKDRWVAALRSGKYRQTENHLKDSNGFCCLGVLADIQGCEWQRVHFWSDPLKDGLSVRRALSGRAAGCDGDQYLERSIAGGLSMSVQNNLAVKNDQGGSFMDIADYIEQNL